LLVQRDSQLQSNDLELALEWKGKDKHQLAQLDRKRWHLTTRSQIIIAIRRNLSNMPARDFGAAALVDVSPDVVVKSELLLGSALIQCFRKFHQECEHDFVQHADNTTPHQLISVVAHGYSNTLSFNSKTLFGLRARLITHTDPII
jgi:hypothetical protein